MNYECVIFDLDGTLLDSKACSVKATKAAFGQMELKVPNEIVIEHYMGIPIEESFLKMSEQPLSKSKLKELILVFRGFYQQFESNTLQVFKGIPEILTAMNDYGIKCYVVSSKKTIEVERNLFKFSIIQYFERIIGSDDVTNYKLHPEGINKILSQNKFDKERTLMIGDTTFDIKMGKAAAVKTMAVTWGSHSQKELLFEQPDFIVNTPSDILNQVLS